ncbi:MAG: amidohydrolase family protein, partial [Bacteroidia bacterium]|nr:amidohydrolase family protein [Bacteroidia bacterium]
KGTFVGDIWIENGKITQIGTVQNPSTNAIVIEAQGKHIYPGFIAPNTILGLAEIEAARATRDYAEVGNITPNVRTQIAYNTDSKIIPTVRYNGILIAQVAATAGLISGLSSIMYLEGWNWEDATLKPNDAMYINIPSFKIYGEDKEGKQKENQDKSVKELFKAFEEAYAYAVAKKANKITQIDQRWEAMIPVFEQKIPVFARANELKQIYLALELAEKYSLKLVLVGASEGWKIAKILADKKIPVVLERIHSLPDHEDEDIDLPFRKPKILHDAGVKFCLSLEGFWQQRNLPFLAGTAIAYGLPAEEALKSITLHAAQILGIADRVGSLEVGKEATLIMTEGDVFDMKSSTLYKAFVQGKEIQLTSIQTELYQKYKQKYQLKP